MISTASQVARRPHLASTGLSVATFPSYADLVGLTSVAEISAFVPASSDRLAIENLVAVLGKSSGSNQRRVCRIDFDGESFWSPGYVACEAMLEHPIEVLGRAIGVVRLGYPDLAGIFDPSLNEYREATVFTALAAQALSARALTREVNRRDAHVEQDRGIQERIEQLLTVGSWRFDPATSSFTWSPEARRILELRQPSGLRRTQRNPILTHLQALVTGAKEPTSFRYEFDFEVSDGVSSFEAIGEVRPLGFGTSFGVLRALEKKAMSRNVDIRSIDPLAELPDRKGLLERLRVVLLKSPTAGALILLSINRIAELNMSRGQLFADSVLRSLGGRLKEAYAPSLVARTGDAEFAVLLEMPMAQAILRAAGLIGMRPLTVLGEAVPFSLSVGTATFPDSAVTGEELLQNASLALSVASTKGPNTHVLYGQELREVAIRREALRSEVKNALAAGEFVPYYQPKVDLRTGAISGFEVLGRWQQGVEVRPPSYFIAALDDAETSREYYMRLLEKVLQDISRWRSRHVAVGRIAVNTSHAEYADFDLATHTLGRLESVGLPASVLGIEITERVVLGADDSTAKNTLNRLRESGIEIALDDFGTGYASLTHLKTYPIDVIKIDRSFVASMEMDLGDRAIVAAITGLGRELGLKVVAEGVETPDQALLLKACACDEVQGYLCSRPMPANEIEAFVARWEPAKISTLIDEQTAGPAFQQRGQHLNARQVIG